jgi:DNA-directed RNA polymerase subunit M/transcription elongation factor TFIIS
MNSIDSLRIKLRTELNIVLKNKQQTKNVEQNVFDFCCSFINKQNLQLSPSVCRKMYITKFQQIYHLLQHDSYVNVNRQHILNMLPNIAYVHYKEICKQKWDLMETDLQVLDSKIINSDENIYTTSVFKCKVCQQNKCIFAEVQTRSCDENTTIFVRCMNCGNCFTC